MIQVTVDLPDTLVTSLGGPREALARLVLEDVVAEACRNGRITRAEAARYLGHQSWHETEDFLVKHEVPLAYDKDDLMHDLAVMDELYPSK